MAKRFDFIKKPSKKIKLDVSVNASHFGTNTSNIADFWGSDDDDFILLATQLEENKHRKPPDVDHQQHKDDEFSFSQFVPPAYDNTSTQQVFGQRRIPTSHKLPSEPADEMPGTSHNPTRLRTEETISFLPELEEVQKDKDKFGTSQWGDCSNSNTTNKRQLAQERQLKFLMERVDVLKKENVKLQKEIVDRNNQTVTKDGEVSLLRNELRQARKMLQANKMDRIAMAEEAEKDCNKKVAEVFKQVIAKNAELNFTNVEFSEHKIRSAQSTFKNQENTESNDADVCRNLLRMENLHITSSKDYSRLNTFDQHIYEYSTETRAQKKRSFVEVELEHLLFHYAQLQQNSDQVIMDQLIMSVCGVFTELWSYAQSLELPQHCMMYPYQHLQQDESVSMRRSLIQPDILYKLERGVLYRRYIATLALICQRQCELSQALLKKKHGNYLILQMVIEAITKLSYSFELCEHFGLIEATASLLQSLLAHLDASKVSQHDLLFNLLKQLVFSRPSPWVFQKLSSCMLLCTGQKDLMAKMCFGSTNNCFVSDRVRSLYRFGPDSCLIQVYSGLLELCFCSDLILQPSHFKLLLSICGNHVRFVYKCFTSMPDFILKMLPLPSFVDDDDKPVKSSISSKIVGLQSDVIASPNSSTLTATNISELTSMLNQDQVSQDHVCECYVKLCLSVVTLVFQMMYQWTLQETKTHVSQVGEISQIAVHLLIVIFREYYQPSLLRDSEETTKHNLSLLCHWWNDNKRILNFENTHLLFLKQLQELQFMLKPLHQETNLSNPDNDLAEWTRLVDNADANIQKYNSQDSQFNAKTLFKHKTSDFFNSLKTTDYNFG